MFRMVVPILPFFYILVQESFRDFYEEYIVNLKSRKASLVFLVIFALILLYTLTPSFYGKRKLDVFLDRNIQNDRHVIGMWLKDNARPQESIALNAIGEIPFLSGLYTTDMLGLTDVYIAHKRRVPSDLGIPGHEKHDSNYVLDKKPTYIILSVGYLTNISDEGDYLTDSYLFPSDRDMLNNSRLRLMYEFRSARIEDKFFNYYRRKDEFG
jgi:hypothetical protein